MRKVSLTLVVLMGMCSVAAAEEYRLSFPELTGTYAYGQLSPVVSVDLGTELISLESIELELVGTHAQGYWQGDMVEDMYAGPKGGAMATKVNTTGGPGDPWTGGMSGAPTGPFDTTLTLHRSGGGADWEFLEDGTTDLQLKHDSLAGFGMFTMLPTFDLTDVTLVVNATPVPEPVTLCLFAVGGGMLLRRRVK